MNTYDIINIEVHMFHAMSLSKILYLYILSHKIIDFYLSSPNKLPRIFYATTNSFTPYLHSYCSTG